MTSTVLIEPHGIYDDGSIHLALDIPSATLARARRGGRLRYTRKGRRVLYLGKWVLAWLEQADNPNRKGVPHG
jgi:hypothetical protein